MANTIKWPSSLQKKANETNNLKMKTFLISIGMIALLIFIVSYCSNKTIENISIGIMWIFIITAIATLKDAFNINPNKYHKGHTGEVIVANALNNLPDNWTIINDIVLNGAQIDHVAVGPSGVYCIETKNWNNAACDHNGNWYRYNNGQWYPTKDNPAKQNAPHVMAVKNFLNSHNVRVHVQSIIVMASKNGLFDIATKVIPPANTTILWPHELSQHMLKEKTLSDGLVKKISGIFARQYGMQNKKAS